MLVTDRLSIEEFLKLFMIEDLIMAIGIGDIENPTAFKILYQSANKPIRTKILEEINLATERGQDTYFQPAMKKVRAITKSAFGASKFLWVDDDMPAVDRGNTRVALPPTLQILSGSGKHLYWQLREPTYNQEELQGLNQNLAHSIEGVDKAAHNSNRWLRIPYSYHSERGVHVKIASYEPDYTYEVDDFYYVKGLFNNDFVTELVNDGYDEDEDRSELNWRAIMELLEAGVSEETIRRLYRYTKLGALLRGRADPQQYVNLTLANARKKTSPPVRLAFTKQETTPKQAPTSVKKTRKKSGPVNPDAGTVVEGTNCYLRIMPKGDPRKISNYLIMPLARCTPHDPIKEVDGASVKIEEYLEVEIRPENGEPIAMMLNVAEIRTYRQLNVLLGSTRTTWMGNDTDMQQLHDLWAKYDIPEVPLLSGSGFHYVEDRWVLASRTKVYTAEGKVAEGYRSLPSSARNGPIVDIQFPVPGFDRQIMAKTVTKVRPENEIWPLLGWFTAATLKPWILQSQHPGFPVLHVGGVSGAGKSTITRNVLMPLFGLGGDSLRDSNITWFVGSLAFSASTSYPLIFTEFRVDQKDHIHLKNALLNVYNNTVASRGNPNKTVDAYRVTTPLVIDSEDSLETGRLRDRLVTVDLRRITDNVHREALSELLRPEVQNATKGFFSALQFWLLELLNNDLSYLEEVMKDATKEIHDLKTNATDRVLINHIIALFGAYLYADFLQEVRPSAEHFEDTIAMSFNEDMQRQIMDIDTMLFRLVMAYDAGDSSLMMKIGANSLHWNQVAGELSFPFRSAMSWWQVECFRTGKPSLAQSALKKQLMVAEYFDREDTAANGAKVVVINLQRMSDIGLEVPTILNATPQLVVPSSNGQGPGD